MSLACGLVNTQPLDTLFGDSDFSTVNAIRLHLQSQDPKKIIAAMICVVVSQELRNNNRTFTLDLNRSQINFKNPETRAFKNPNSRGWTSFVRLLAFPNLQIIDPTTIIPTSAILSDMIPDLPEFDYLQPVSDTDATLIFQKNISDDISIDLIELNSKDPILGSYIIYAPGIQTVLVKSAISNIKQSIDTFTPAKKNVKKISQLHPQLIAKAVHQSLTTIQKEIKDSPDKKSFVSSLVKSLEKDVMLEMSSSTSSSTSSYTSQKEMFNLISIESFSLFKNSRVSEVPNELSIKLRQLLASFEASTKSTIDLLNSNLNTQDKKQISENYFSVANDLAETLSDISIIVNINSTELQKYGFVESAPGTFAFNPTQTSIYNQIPRPNPLPVLTMPVKSIATIVVNTMLITIGAVILIEFLAERIAKYNAILLEKSAKIAAATADKICSENPNSPQCTQAKNDAKLAQATADASKAAAENMAQQSLLSNLVNTFNSAAQQLPAIVNTFLWVAGLGVTAVVSKKLWDYSNSGSEK